MRLHDYFRSSAAYRVRIALHLKGVDFEALPVDLRAGAQAADEYTAINPQRLVPTLEDGQAPLTQSLAICEYLDETRPQPPLLPDDPAARARVRALAQLVACDIHPLNNLRVLQYLTGTLGVSEEDKLGWYRNWVRTGFDALEPLLAGSSATGTYCHGESVTLADVCLVPQVHNARRYEVDLAPWPTIRRIDAACLALPAFDRARPGNQPAAT